MLAAQEAKSQSVSHEVAQLRSMLWAEQDALVADMRARHKAVITALGELAALRAERDALIADMRAGHKAVTTALGELAAALREQQARTERQLAELTRAQARSVIPLGTEMLARTPYGWLLAPVSDIALTVALFESGGELEPGTTRVLNALLQEGDTFLDAGAHLGLMTLPAARRVGWRGQVIAVEPTPELVGLLRRMLALNDVDAHVIVHACAAGERAGRQEFNIAPIRGHSSLLPLDGASERIEVDVRPLDALVPAGTPVRLAKIDVEGFELPVWRGMRRIVADNPDLSVIVEFGPSHLRRSGTTIADWLRELTAPGVTAYEIDEDSGVCRPLRRTGLDEVVSINLLLLRHPPEHYPEVCFA